MDVEKIEHELQKIRDNKIQNIVEVLTAAVYDERYYDVFLDLQNFSIIYREVEPDEQVELYGDKFKLLSFNPDSFNRLGGESEVRREIGAYVKKELLNDLNKVK
ncbi:hypothetical protein [Methanobrevibacter boviskoreani]|uniref:hypothetical protein n=1 Tax=Methanobrevibacter boviskoreani TaxID=1348249 RepID=UPI000593D5C4|nr:hypothetical protein [Methanobrevibacter boviskoreani]